MDENVSMILSLLTGVALFIFGMHSMSAGLKKVAGNKMELILYKLTNTPIKGFLLGTAVTCVIQSSSAATVMVVGFVNSGMMGVSQAIGVILGANIGTSITGWIVSMSYIEGAGWAAYFSSTTITAVFAVIGMLLQMFAKKDTYKDFGTILLGFAVLMVGMSTMSGAVSPLKTNPVFINAMTALENPILATLFGILFSGILQSSSAAVGVLQALSTTGAISFTGAFPIVMGIGIGASFPVLLSAIGASRNGKRTAIMYLVVALIATLLGIVIYYPLELAGVFHLAGMTMNPFTIAATNSLFRIITMCLLVPFISGLKRLIYILMPATDAETEDLPDFEKLEDRLLDNPDLAYAQAMEVMDGMARKARKNVYRAMELLENYTPQNYQKVADLENTLNKYEDKLGQYLVKLTSAGVTIKQGQSVSKALQAISDFEAIGDYALSIADIAKDLDQKKEKFSLAATDELTVIGMAVEEAMEITVNSFITEEAQEVKRVFPLSELVNLSVSSIKKRHIKRLKEGKCSMEMGFVQSDLLRDMQRIVEHCSNIALDLVESSEQNFNVHRFLRKYREDSQNEYSELLQQYETKYSI